MNLVCQKESIKQLETFCKEKKHSILIDGPTGCGKTYLAKYYASLLHVHDFQVINPVVSDLRNAIDDCFRINNDIVICIENLDLGVVSASYVILKFLEEPADNVYIVVTCRNLMKVPDTIISRSSCISAYPPIKNDMLEFAKEKYPSLYQKVYNRSNLINCMRTFNDVDTLCNLSEDKLDYIVNLSDIDVKSDSVSNTVWSYGHFSDSTETPLEIVIKYISDYYHSSIVQRSAIECIKDINQGRVAKHIALTKFVFDLKYVKVN